MAFLLLGPGVYQGLAALWTTNIQKWSCLITAVIVIYSGHGFAAFLWVCICVTACDCVCGLIHITHTCPLPTAGAATTSPRDTIKSPGRKAGLSGWMPRRDRLTGQFLSLLVSEGSLARRRRPEMSGQSKSAIYLNTVGWLRDVKQSQLVASLCLLCTEPCTLTQRETGRPDQASVSQQLRWSACRAAEVTGRGHW